MQGKAAFYGSQMDKFNMFIVFSMALVFCVSIIHAVPTDSETEGRSCCPLKICYKLEFNSKDNNKMNFVLSYTPCGCDSALGQICLKSAEDLKETVRFLTAKSQQYEG